MTEDIRPLVEQFNARGYVVLANALSLQQVAALNRAVDRYLERFPLASGEWAKTGSASFQAGDVLPHTSAFDAAIEHPAALAFARAWFGEDVTFEHLSLVIRGPEPNPTEPKGWHRDNTRAYDRRHEIGAISVIYYLTDVSATDHCFSIIPETHNRRVDLSPEEVSPGEGVDVTGPAGTAVIFHARCIHSGKVKPESRQRRTLHVYYWQAGKPRTSNTSTIPPRLYEKADPGLPPRLYAKWDVRDVFDALGRTKET
jgi:ectoine hydroxylase-related dioxygenase (phytanoyl-CoA dioxygenase family)